MRQDVVTGVKREIAELLTSYIRDEAKGRNGDDPPTVSIEGVEDGIVAGTLLLWEIRVVLGVLGKPWQCDLLVNDIYKVLQAHHLSRAELQIVMMSLHVEVRTMARGHPSRMATIRYIFEEMAEDSIAIEYSGVVA